MHKLNGLKHMVSQDTIPLVHPPRLPPLTDSISFSSRFATVFFFNSSFLGNISVFILNGLLFVLLLEMNLQPLFGITFVVDGDGLFLTYLKRNVNSKGIVHIHRHISVTKSQRHSSPSYLCDLVA